MRIVVDRTRLLKSLGRVHRVVERRNTIPILANVLIDTHQGHLVLKATDLDVEATETSEALIEAEGGITVPAHLLYDIIRKLPDGAEIALSTKDEASALTITSGRANFRLAGLPREDFPQVSTGKFTHQFEIKSEDLKRLIDRTQFAISTEETRYYLNGIYFHVVTEETDVKFRAVATDGHRLALMECQAPVGSETMPGIILPRKGVSELQRLVAEESDGIVKIELSDAKIRFSLGSVVLTSKVVDGTFPEYQRVIPTANDKKLLIDRAAFTGAVDRVATVSSERSRAVKLSLGSGKIVISVHNPEQGSAEDELVADYDSEPLEIGFNARYLLDITGQLSAEKAVFMFADAGSPTLVRDGEALDALYVLMPMRV